MCDNASTTDSFLQLDAYIDTLPYKKENLIGILHQAQELYGYLPDQLQWHIAQKLDIPSAKVYGVVSFYSYFTMKPRGKHTINICMGTACFVRGAQKLQAELEKQLEIKTGQTTADNLFSLDSLRCIGACSLAPVMMIDGTTYGRLHEPEEIRQILDTYRSQRDAMHDIGDSNSNSNPNPSLEPHTSNLELRLSTITKGSEAINETKRCQCPE